MVCYRLNGFWYSKEDKIISIDAINKLLEKEKEVVLKQAIGSSGGRNIFFISKNTCNGNFNNNFWHIIDGIKEDLIVQKVIRQHPGLAQLNPSSVNTIRVLSMLCLDGVKVYSTALRVGREGARVDNGHSGGIHCGIKSDGTLRRVAHTDLGEEFLEHPYSKIVFENYEIPGYKKILEAVERLHPMIPHFRLVSWDMSVDEEGEPVLIEANLNYGGVSIHQMENGPLFGKDTKDILDEVFGKRTIDSGLERKFRKEH